MSVKRLVPLHAVELTDDPAIESSRKGEIYYNSVSDELRFFDGSSWSPVAGALTGLLDHIHTYDGAIYSVESIQVNSSGVIDGGTP